MKKPARLLEVDHSSALFPQKVLLNSSLRTEFFGVPVFENVAVMEIDQGIGLEREFFIIGLLSKALYSLLVGKS